MHLDEPQVRTSEVARDAGEAAPVDRSPARPGGGAPFVVRLLVVAVLVAAVALRFVTRSPLWLDEALTVNIAKAPLSKIPGLLRDDGAPPLYYLLLHFWMKAFGTGDVASRALAGVLGVINLPVAWITGFRVGARSWSLATAPEAEQADRRAKGKVTAWGVTLLLATSPFAVYYDTEARMYGLVLLLGTLAVLSWTFLLARPGWRPAAAIFVVTSAALYTHYWSLYLGAVAGAGALWCAVRGPHREAARWGVAGLVAGALSFLPWLPTFYFQARHTGTPWSVGAQFTDIVTAFTQFAGGISSAARGLTLVFFFLLVLAVFGTARDRRHVTLDLATSPGVRALAAAVIATLVVAVIAARLSGSAFADRYTSIIAFPALLVIAYGLTSLADVRVRDGVLAAAIALGLGASIPNATIVRTQAGTVAAAIQAGYHRGDVIGYCPDQLGPSVSRLLGELPDQVTFPRDARPEIVDWVDYAATIKRASPYRFAELLERLAGGHTIWYVNAPGYQGFGNDCADVAIDLARTRAQHGVVADLPSTSPFEIYEGMALSRFTPR